MGWAVVVAPARAVVVAKVRVVLARVAAAGVGQVGWAVMAREAAVVAAAWEAEPEAVAASPAVLEAAVGRAVG